MTQYPYQDAAAGVPERVADLMGRMSVEEKAGLLFHPIITMNADGSLVDDRGGGAVGRRRPGTWSRTGRSAISTCSASAVPAHPAPG